MPTTTAAIAVKGQVTIPKKVRKTSVRAMGKVLGVRRDRFEAARGKAQVKWCTAGLMALLRGAD